MQLVGTIGFLLLKCELMECEHVSIFPGTGEGPSAMGEKEKKAHS